MKLYRVLWNNQSESGATWEREDYLQATYPSFYEKWYIFQISRRDFCKGGRAVTLLVLALHVKHLHCIGMSIITFTHKHLAMIICHFM
jgi:hypothetical protein